jgi:hypothetical protein
MVEPSSKYEPSTWSRAGTAADDRCCGMPVRQGLWLWALVYLVLDAFLLYGACVRAAGNTKVPFWGDASVPLVKGEPWVSWVEIGFAAVDALLVLLALGGVMRGTATALRTGFRAIMLSLILYLVEWLLLIALVTSICLRSHVAFTAWFVIVSLLALPFLLLAGTRLCFLTSFREYTMARFPHHDDGSEFDGADDDDAAQPLLWA